MNPCPDPQHEKNTWCEVRPGSSNPARLSFLINSHVKWWRPVTMVTRPLETEGVTQQRGQWKAKKSSLSFITQMCYILPGMIPLHVNRRTSRNGQLDIYSIKVSEFKSQQNPTGLRTTAKTPRLVSSLQFTSFFLLWKQQVNKTKRNKRNQRSAKWEEDDREGFFKKRLQ